jgi:hypothetical protein
MEPDPENGPELSGIMEDLLRHESIFAQPAPGTTKADYERMTSPDFWEIGASGKRYSRAEVLDALEKRPGAPDADVWKASDIHCRRLACDLYLLTYTLLQNEDRLTRRASIWQRMDKEWKIVFHQGTLVPH